MDESGQPSVNTSPYSSPMHTLTGSIIFLTNPENDIYKLELTLRGLVEQNGKFIQASDPLLNEEGVRSIVGQVQGLVNRITVLSKFNDREVYNLIMFLADTMIKDLMLNVARYQIKNPSARDRIVMIACSTAFECLKRGHEQGERNFWKGSQQEITTRTDGGQKKGLMARAISAFGGQ